jgi:hypothetical protein
VWHVWLDFLDAVDSAAIAILVFIVILIVIDDPLSSFSAVVAAAIFASMCYLFWSDSLDYLGTISAMSSAAAATATEFIFVVGTYVVIAALFVVGLRIVRHCTATTRL